ncbi:lipopolysaccharide transport periplasmic protein LptA [Aquabacterium sp. CECT 9606]|uniref:lipopolysaccharide transport periplasmic protein LptA n=1 Tax=Aquabacterium sp. CECT 9606 TaxID=2845822 RepID=UPI001E651A43|nr:lipopolysaccharide transport periplasmic protein LptA [Aquabacterium sp. CECT 9606]CAH0356232.1 Lipopolysaccharide export system protein LptA [Aquabacterium sp. CECT 9606]
MPNMSSFSTVPLLVLHRLAQVAGRVAPTVAAALLGVAVLAVPARAEKADRDQPLNFSADSARVDDTQRINVLTGNVEITKGSMVFRAARVEVRQNADGTQTANARGAGTNGRAYFRQKREGLDEFIEGEGDRVEYDGASDTVRFTGRAIMRRLRGSTLADEVVGQTIVYDNRTEVFQVVGGAGSAMSSGRVRGVIAPRPAASAPAKSTPDAGRDKGASLSPSSTLSPSELESARR